MEDALPGSAMTWAGTTGGGIPAEAETEVLAKEVPETAMVVEGMAAADMEALSRAQTLHGEGGMPVPQSDGNVRSVNPEASL
mmetsp:Transcript_4959/g.5495  ORF Transcript_4959/g.5495 Transcript_4959/m.5495 type:complete len:82 (+) Transcript_4959:1-246(+)